MARPPFVKSAAHALASERRWASVSRRGPAVPLLAEAPAERRRPFGPRSVWRRSFGSAPPPVSWFAGSGSFPRAPRAGLPWDRGVKPYVGKGLMRAALAPHRRALRQPSGGIGGPGLRQSLAGCRLVRELGH